MKIIAMINTLTRFYLRDFFYFGLFFRRVKVMSFKKTIKKIVENHMSLSRYGDGEFCLMFNILNKIGFQDNNELLRNNLLDSFKKTNNCNLLISIAPFYSYFNSKTSKFVREWRKEYTRVILPNLKGSISHNYYYGNAEITRFYHPTNHDYTNYKKVDKHVKSLKTIWFERDLIIVEGENTMLGIGNDLFSGSNSIKRILAPSKNAYDYIDSLYERIIDTINKFSMREKELLILLALGPTASILSTMIAEKTNYQAIDIGHIDIVYLWYINKSKACVGVGDKYVNERNTTDSINIFYDRADYLNQIVAKVGV